MARKLATKTPPAPALPPATKIKSLNATRSGFPSTAAPSDAATLQSLQQAGRTSAEPSQRADGPGLASQRWVECCLPIFGGDCNSVL